MKKAINRVGANLKGNITNLTLFIVVAAFIASCVNPFAPRLDLNSSESGLISDRKDIEGVFKNLQYSYTFKDTTIYGELLNPDYNFSYRDYDLGADISWGRDEEMKVTYGLFENTEKLDLIWNNVVSLSEDSTNVIRSFNLTITFNPTDIVLVDGRVNLTLQKDKNKKWRIVRWVDESNF